MDPLSHALVGLSIFGMKYAPALTNPACVGAMIGAVAPDFDIAARVKGDYVYLKHHRVETHSLPGITILSLLITLTLSLFYTNFLFKEVFFWTLIGGVSHIILDYLNSYGVALLYPLNRKKHTLNLLMIYDPIILLICGYILFLGRKNAIENILLVLVIAGYLLVRRRSQQRLKDKLEKNYSGRQRNLELMPSTFNPFKWDFIVETKNHFFVGEMNSLMKTTVFSRKLKKVENIMIEKSLTEELGVYFKSFTPFFHIDVIEKEKEKILVKMTDLRYRINNEFMHHAFFFYNKQNGDLVNSIFYPFVLENRIDAIENNQ